LFAIISFIMAGERSAWQRFRRRAALPVAAVGAISLASGVVAPSPAESSASGYSAAAFPTGVGEHHPHPQSKEVFVSSRVQRVSTGVDLKPGDRAVVEYERGKWTVGGSQNYSDARGLDPWRDSQVWPYGDQIGRSCRVDDRVTYGTALGYDGDGEFPIGNHAIVTPRKPGGLSIGINDNDYANPDAQQNCLGDNRDWLGQPLVFKVTVYPARHSAVS
jgi:hypothetical protein